MIINHNTVTNHSEACINVKNFINIFELVKHIYGYHSLCKLLPDCVKMNMFKPNTYMQSQPTCNFSLQWRHNGHTGISNQRYLDVCSTICSGADQRKHQSTTSLAFVSRIHQWPVDSPHKGLITLKNFHHVLHIYTYPKILPRYSHANGQTYY